MDSQHSSMERPKEYRKEEGETVFLKKKMGKLKEYISIYLRV
jgi:hypothetical protein